MPAVTARISRWLRTRAEATERDLAEAGLDRHVDLGVTEEIEAILGHAQATGDIVLIHSRSGRGKSWAAGRYCRTHTAAHMATMSDAVATISGMLGRVSRSVGAGSKHGSGLKAEEAIIEKVQGRARADLHRRGAQPQAAPAGRSPLHP